ncbi:MAG TPA: transposase [Thermodesulfobacteriota bacterium]|nr:transposase [Thermodesulfobacteriota bacterium]
MGLYKDKYRIDSTRLKDWDYSSSGYYFVTICTKKQECFFGEVVDGQIRLFETGEIAAEEWQKTEQIRQNVKLDEWVVMPNHIHGIVIITNNVETTRRVVSTLKPNSLGAIIGQFKSVTTKRIRAKGYSDFAWQPRFYEHIVRSEESLEKIREYILNNPIKWELDEYHPENLIVAKIQSEK